jgi:hypothetical protein
VKAEVDIASWVQMVPPNGAPELSVAARQVKPAWVKASVTAALADCVVIKMRQTAK